MTGLFFVQIGVFTLICIFMLLAMLWYVSTRQYADALLVLGWLVGGIWSGYPIARWLGKEKEKQQCDKV